MDTKKCSDCQQTKPVGDFYKANKSSNGLACICKTCNKNRIKQYQQSEKGKEARRRYEKVKQEKVPTRYCPCCKETLPKSEFDYKRTIRDGLAVCCKKCTAKREKK